MPDGISLEPVAPAEAIAALRRRGLNPFPSFSWLDVDARTHRAGFTVAKSTQFDVVGDIYAELQRVLSEGRTFDQFKKDLAPTLKAKGWWGRAPMTDPETGETRMVQLGSERRLRIIFDTNLRMSHSEARWRQIQRAKDRRPYLRYVAVLDERTRPEHRRWHGTILPVDHPWWRTHFPPNGWRCRCMVQQLSERDLKRNGWKVSEAPPDDPRPWRNRRTGEERQVPDGVDPGFDHSPGALAMEEDGMRAALDKIDAMREAGAPAAVVDAARGALDAGPAGERPSLEAPRGPRPPAPPVPAPVPEMPALTPAEQRAAARVVQLWHSETVEWLIGVDLVTGRAIGRPTRGAADSVPIPPAVERAIGDVGRHVALVHTHPSGRSFSPEDIVQLASNPGLDRVVAVGPEGSLYAATVVGAREGIAGPVTEAWTAATRYLVEAVRRRRLARDAADMLVDHIAASALAAEGGLDYVAILGPDRAAAADAALIDEAILFVRRSIRARYPRR